MGNAPAFRFYPADYVIGTMLLSAAERGIYVDLLCHQWSVGAVPGDDCKALAKIMRVSAREAKAHWSAVADKFDRGDDGLWRNKRLEVERQKQESYRATQSENGHRSAATKAQRKANQPSNQPSTTVEPPLQPTFQPPLQPNGQPNSTFRFQSSFSSSEPPPKNGGGGRASALIRSSLDREKALRFNVFVGSRLEVPRKIHADFCRLLGGEEPEMRLLAWYAELDAEIETSREAIVPDVWKWLQSRYTAWASSVVEDAGMAAIMAWANEGAVDRG